VVITGGTAIGVGGGGFVLGVTAGGLSDAFLLGAAGAMAVATVGAFVGGIKWLFTLDAKMTDHSTLLREISLRLSKVEGEFTTNGGGTALDAINRIDRRSRAVAESVGATDYDDEDS
jgi:hypothetical protein